MNNNKNFWELTILDGKVDVTDAEILAAADIDGDGHTEMITGGNGSLLWYRPDPFEKGLIGEGNFHCAVVQADSDNDGMPAVFAVCGSDGQNMLAKYKPGVDHKALWEMGVLDARFEGHAGDMRFADIDADGVDELLVASRRGGVFEMTAYKRGCFAQDGWTKHRLALDTVTEHFSVGDLDGDGRLEIVCGPDWFKQPDEGPFNGLWERHTYAADYREISRTAVVDITGSGYPDIVIAESEYMDGSLSWFENRLTDDVAHPWTTHVLDDGLIYARSLEVKHDFSLNRTLIFIAEKETGGPDTLINHGARLITYATVNRGDSWEREIIAQGEGAYRCIFSDTDGRDGWVGGLVRYQGANPKLQIWKQKEAAPFRFVHRFLDREKTDLAVEILTADVDGDGKTDVLCGSCWYKNPSWERFAIPDVYQVVNHYDIDGDGREEFVVMKRDPRYPENDYMGLMSGALWWVKPIDPVRGRWDAYCIGTINGDWVHGSVIAPLLPGGAAALIVCYHDSLFNGNPPEIFEIPSDPRMPWRKRIFAAVKYNEHLVLCGKDVVSGQHWFVNNGDGSFSTCPMDLHTTAARIGVADINGDGKTDVVVGQKLMGTDRVVPFAEFFWLENPGENGCYPWKRHVIDLARNVLSVCVADIDGDGEDEIIAGEHDPYRPYNAQCRLFAYKKAEKTGTVWRRYLIDHRFEHHVGGIVFEIEPGRIGIVSHGWADKKYVHLWEVEITNKP